MNAPRDILLTGGSGEIGRPSIASLVAAGDRVRASARSESGARIVEKLGAEAIELDLFDASALRRAVAGADAVIHLATVIPPSADMGDLSQWEENDRLRSETTAHLAAATAEEGARLILQSYFGVAEPRGSEWIEEGPERKLAWSGIGVMDSMRDAELAALGSDGVVLRFGSLYSETSEQLQAQVAMLRGGEAFIPGAGDNYWPFLASPDAGRAVAASLELEPGVYDVNDDEPLQLSEFWRIAAEATGQSPPPHTDVGGHPMAPILTGSWRTSNAAFCEASGWRPQAVARRDWPEAAARFEREQPRRRPL